MEAIEGGEWDDQVQQGRQGGGAEAGTSNLLTPKACRWELYAPDLLGIAVLVLQIKNLAARPPLPPLINKIVGALR